MGGTGILKPPRLGAVSHGAGFMVGLSSLVMCMMFRSVFRTNPSVWNAMLRFQRRLSAGYTHGRAGAGKDAHTHTHTHAHDRGGTTT